MYLEPIQAFSQLPMQVRCKDGTFDTARGVVPACRNRGGVATGTPSIPPKPKFKAGYILKGTPPSNSWVYPNCNAGYVKQMVNKPHPEMYSCFDPAELAWNKKYGIMF
jgi:hypothetical protein